MPKKTINHEDSLFSIQNDATEPHLIDDEFVDMNVWPFNKKEKHQKRTQRDENARKKVKSLRMYAFNPTPKNEGKLLHTRKMCSCWMCGNPRKHHHEPTLKEKLSQNVYKDEYKHWDDQI